MGIGPIIPKFVQNQFRILFDYEMGNSANQKSDFDGVHQAKRRLSCKHLLVDLTKSNTSQTTGCCSSTFEGKSIRASWDMLRYQTWQWNISQ